MRHPVRAEVHRDLRILPAEFPPDALTIGNPEPEFVEIDAIRHHVDFFGRDGVVGDDAAFVARTDGDDPLRRAIKATGELFEHPHRETFAHRTDSDDAFRPEIADFEDHWAAFDPTDEPTGDCGEELRR